MAKQYLIKQTLWYPTDKAVIARLKAGENLPIKERGPIRQAEPGEIVSDLPLVSIPGLLEHDYIEEYLGVKEDAATTPENA